MSFGINPGIPGARDTELASEETQLLVKTALDNIFGALGGGEFNQEIDTTLTSNTIYIGEAVPGTATSSALWRIKKLDTASGVSTTWADGDSDFDNVWDNRGSLSYS